MNEAIISVRGLRKTYGDVEAIRGVDFEIQPGEVFGLLGPNGAGKTSTVEILEGLRPRTGGDVSVLGFDPDKQKEKLKDRIGVCLQATNLPDKMRVHEALELFASFYTRNVNPNELLRRLQLQEKHDAYYTTLSGGQKQRLALALALLNDPALLFLDEPTTGLDPQVRAEIHLLLEELRNEKRTILLTTHYIEEAERLCDRVAIIDQGKIIALDTPRNLQQQSKTASSIVITCNRAIPKDHPQWPETVSTQTDSTGRTLTVVSRRPAATLVELIKWIDQQGLELVDVSLKQPTLEDVFIEMTGRRLRD
ncbi:MAG TPA: ABC transporter ATP-binding protein [Terriglobales bacterium]|nr:ABC transporter ATP-binding protein [Terriglobales bacterium]